MKFSTKLTSEQGSAVLDLIGFGVLLQIPVLVFATLAIQTQQQSFAVEAIARHGLRAHVLWPDIASTTRVIDELALDFGISSTRIRWSLSCRPDPSCRTPGSLAEMQVRLGEVVAYSTQRI